MSRREPSNFFFLRKIIRSYYSKRPLEEPIYLHKREIALQSLEDGVYIRHLSFPSMTKLYNYILNEKTPLHLYYSSAYYDNPSNTKMELKEWLGSDLLFDIDADRYTGCDKVYTICIKSNKVFEGKTECPNNEEPLYYPVISIECMNRAFYDVIKLYMILKEEFGFRNINIYFSGNKGFHVKVYDEAIQNLTREERRELASYILLENINVEKIFPSIGKKKKYMVLSSNEYGIRKRILRLIKNSSNIQYEVLGEYIKIPYEELYLLIEEARVNIDAVVTMDISRLSRFGFSLNCKSGLVVHPINIDEFDEFDPMNYNPWEGGMIVKPLIDASLYFFNEKIELKRGSPIYLDSYIAIHLAFKNLVKIIDLKDFGVK